MDLGYRGCRSCRGDRAEYQYGAALQRRMNVSSLFEMDALPIIILSRGGGLSIMGLRIRL